MNAQILTPMTLTPTTEEYARAISASKKARFQIEQDVIRGRTLDLEHKYMPDGLSLVTSLGFLTADEQRLLSQVQGRTYANIFGLVERFINAKVLELTGQYWLGNQVALEALVRFSDEEIKHQELFRRVEALAARNMPAGYQVVPEPDHVARIVLEKPTWSVLGLICHIELFVLAHYRQSIDIDPTLSPLWKDVFRFHWKEESQHVILDELEWRRENARLTPDERDRAVDEFIGLVAAVDGILQAQAASDARYFKGMLGYSLDADQSRQIDALLLRAYRFQYIGSGVAHTRFPEILFSMLTSVQRSRVESALGPLL